MKKKIIGVAVLATVVISAAAWNFNQGKNETKLNDISLANVEALAQGENDGPCHNCYSTSGICWMTALDGCLGIHMTWV